MPNIAKFKVLVPAMSSNGPNGTTITDPQPVYGGAACDLPRQAARQIGNAIVMGGTDLGGRIHGCTYITPQYPVPGFGEITFH